MRAFPAVALLATTCVLAAQRTSFVDTERGLKLDVPAGWAQLPPYGERGSLIGFWLGPRLYESKEGNAHQPALRIFWFPKTAAARETPDTRDGYPLRTPYRSFDDYVKRGMGKEADVKSREKKTIGKLQGERVTVILPLEQAGDLELNGVLIPRDDGEVFVELESLAEHHDKIVKPFEPAFDSLGAPPPGAKSTPADAEWKPYKSQHFKVVSRADPKLTARVIEAADAARSWVQKQFGAMIAKNVEPVTLRVFAAPTELAAFQSREPLRREYLPEQREILTAADANIGKAGNAFGTLIHAVLTHWLHESDPKILAAMPRWLDQALWEYTRSSDLKGKDLKFVSSDNENARIRNQQQADTMPALWAIIQEGLADEPNDGRDRRPWEWTQESARLLRWVEAGNGKLLGHPDFLIQYLKGIPKGLAKAGPDPTIDIDRRLLTGGQKQDLNKLERTWRDKLLSAINETVVPLQEPAWRTANENWLEWNRKTKM